MNEDRIFVDTNVLVYYRDASEPVKQARAAENDHDLRRAEQVGFGKRLNGAGSVFDGGGGVRSNEFRAKVMAHKKDRRVHIGPRSWRIRALRLRAKGVQCPLRSLPPARP